MLQTNAWVESQRSRMWWELECSLQALSFSWRTCEDFNSTTSPDAKYKFMSPTSGWRFVFYRMKHTQQSRQINLNDIDFVENKSLIIIKKFKGEMCPDWPNCEFKEIRTNVSNCVFNGHCSLSVRAALLRLELLLCYFVNWGWVGVSSTMWNESIVQP